ncbi:MAG: two-component response regulator [Acidobacteria bacterium]|nr:two-component response regulator [Acidobacteriota bacterium]
MSGLRPPVALLVQPEHDDREMYAEFLTYQGLAAIPVSTARQAMTTAPGADVIITGVRLPGEIDGIDLIAWLRRDRRTMNIPIVVLTACVWGTERERAETAGCDLFLVKPCLPCELLRQVRRLLARSGFRGQ